MLSCYYFRTASKEEEGTLQRNAVHSVQHHTSLTPENARAEELARIEELARAEELAKGHPVQRDISPYPLVGVEAFAFVREMLRSSGVDLSISTFRRGSHQPINEEIVRVNNLFWNVAFKKFEELLKSNQDDPWNNQDVIHAADAVMKIGYVSSCLTLEDLKPFTENLTHKGENRTFEEALTSQDSYQYRTFYHCTRAYHWLRGEIKWYGENQYQPHSRPGLYHMPPIGETHAALFYQKGMIQNKWNELYNDYCDRVRLYVSEEELEKEDPRHVNWTRRDAESKTFRSTPDTLPT